jgi:endonuclease/exonuclease/phosphatase family metal-dependent hydrolase
MRIVCFNIHGGRCGTGASRPSLPAVADTLRSASPDICLLQEIDRRLPRSGFVDQARRLARAMSDPKEPEWYWAFYGRLDFGPVGAFGNALMAREPLTGIRRLPLPSVGGEPRCALGATFSVSGKTLRVWNTHLGLREEWRETQLAALAAAVNADKAAGYAVLVGGDFNARLDAPEVARFAERTELTLVSAEAMTFPASGPTTRIDFLWASPEIIATNAGIIAEPNASDHALIWADIEIGSTV